MLTQKKKNPIIYHHQDVFISSLRNKMNDSSLNISISLINLDDTRADVFINNILVGIISSYTNENKKENHVLSFIPNSSFFNFAYRNEVDKFITLSNDFFKSYANTVYVKDLENLKEKKLDDFNVFSAHNFRGSFMSKEIGLQEFSSLSFRLIKDGVFFKLVDFFCVKISTRPLIFPVVGIEENVIPFKDLLCFSLCKNNDILCVHHDSIVPIHSLTVKDNEAITTMSNFIANVSYYGYMKLKKMELPTFDDFLSNIDDYKQVFDMVLI